MEDGSSYRLRHQPLAGAGLRLAAARGGRWELAHGRSSSDCNMADELDDFLRQNREIADTVEGLRGLWESDKHWRARRDFLVRNLSDYRRDRMDDLIALSMVWSNHIFMGCRYNDELMEKVLEMADGVEVEDAPQFTTRDEIMKQGQ
ncbi:CDKN2AIP N-terminal-like protein [Narcine bancroftii]|uniref:CDKN2AIP N-terminal-like protein n=1 Tax=Narcine bancroftii TaxID=1343680 RepID=UPI003831845C